MAEIAVFFLLLGMGVGFLICAVVAALLAELKIKRFFDNHG